MKFYVVIREKPGAATNYSIMNHRYETYQEAVARAVELTGKTNEAFIILEAFERISPLVQVKRELLHNEEVK